MFDDYVLNFKVIFIHIYCTLRNFSGKYKNIKILKYYIFILYKILYKNIIFYMKNGDYMSTI